MIVRRFVYALYLLVAAAEPAVADVFDDCNQFLDPKLRVDGCTAIIEGGDQFADDQGDAYNNRGLGYSALGLTEQAIADFTMAISIYPDYVFAYVNRGFAYMRLPQYFLAIDDFNHVLEVAPGTPAAYVGLGLIELNHGSVPYEAIPYFDQAIALLPNYPNAYYYRGNAYRYEQEFARAIADYDQVLALDRDGGYVYYGRGLSHCSLGHTDEAMADFEASWAYNPENIVRIQRRLSNRGLISDVSGVADHATRTALRTWIKRSCAD